MYYLHGVEGSWIPVYIDFSYANTCGIKRNKQNPRISITFINSNDYQSQHQLFKCEMHTCMRVCGVETFHRYPDPQLHILAS